MVATKEIQLSIVSTDPPHRPTAGSNQVRAPTVCCEGPSLDSSGFIPNLDLLAPELTAHSI